MCYDLRYNFWTDILQHKLHCQYLFQQIKGVRKSTTCCYCTLCPHSTHLCPRVFDILPFATAILRPKQHKDSATELWNSYSCKISLFSLLLWVYYLYKYVFVYKFFWAIFLLSCFIQCLSIQHRSSPTCFRYSTIRYSSDNTTSGFGKEMAAIFPVSILTCVSSSACHFVSACQIS